MNLASLSTSDWQARAATLRYETGISSTASSSIRSTKGRFTVVNPATGAPLCEVSAGTAEDIDLAVAAAQAQLCVEGLEPHGAARPAGRAGGLRR